MYGAFKTNTARLKRILETYSKGNNGITLPSNRKILRLLFEQSVGAMIEINYYL